MGLIRLLFALATGQPIDFGEFGAVQMAVLVVVYCASFSLAGAVLSVLWPLRESRLGAYLLGYLGAGIVTVVLGGLIMWLEHDHDFGTNAIVGGIMTVIFGTAAGYKIEHW